MSNNVESYGLVPAGLFTYDLRHLPVYVPSILKHYKKETPQPKILANLSPGNNPCFVNIDIDIDVSIVAVSAFIGVRRLIDCSGVIIDWDSKHREATILTSAKVVRYPQVMIERELLSYFHVIVRLFNGEPLVARQEYVDYHLNIALLKVPTTASSLKAVEFVRSLPSYNLQEISVLGRQFSDVSLKKVDGVLRSYPPSFGCDDLVTSTCRATESFEGGPVINKDGEVMGINFLEKDGHAHLLPCNSFLRSVFLSKGHREVSHLWSGLTVIDEANLSNATRRVLCMDSSHPPVLVKQVFTGSPADKVGVYPGDQVISCDNVPVDSADNYLDLVNNILDAREDTTTNTHSSVQMTIRRHVDGEIIRLEAEFVAVNDRRFCILWPFNEDIWERGTLSGSQEDSLLKWCHQPKKSRHPTK